MRNLADDGSQAGKQFFFKVSAVNSIGEGPQSNAYLVVAATLPDAP